MKKCGTKKKTKNQIQKGENLSCKKATINRDKGDSVLDHTDQIKPQGEYKEQNGEISAIPSINDLLNNLYRMKCQKTK